MNSTASLPPELSAGRTDQFRSSLTATCREFSFRSAVIIDGVTLALLLLFGVRIGDSAVIAGILTLSGIWIHRHLAVSRTHSTGSEEGALRPGTVSTLCNMFIAIGLVTMCGAAAVLFSRAVSSSPLIAGSAVWGCGVLFWWGGATVLRAIASRKSVPVFIATVALFLVLRLLFLGLPELIPEEGYYWLYAKNLAAGYLDHPPMVGWLIWIGTALFGHNEFGVRSGALFSWCVAGFFIFRYSRAMYSSEVAWGALALAAALPFFSGIGFTIAPDSPLIAAWAAALYFLRRAIVENSSSSWIWMGLAVGIGLLSKYTIVLIGPIALCSVVLHPPARRALLSPSPYAGALLAALLFMPVIAWNAQNGWASFEFQGPRRLEMPTTFALHLFVLDLIALVTPLGVLGAALLVRRGERPELPKHHGDRTLLFSSMLVPIAVFALYSLRHETKLNWAGPAFLLALPALAAQIVQSASTLAGSIAHRGAWLARGWALTATFLFAAFGVVLLYFNAGLPFTPFSSSSRRFVGWESLAVNVAAIADAANTGEVPVIVGMDKHNIASELSFYLAKRGKEEFLVLGRDIFGLESLMFRMWRPNVDLTDRTMVLVARGEHDLRTELLTPFFASISPIEKIPTEREGKSVGTYYFRIGHGFRPLTPAE